MIVPAYPRKLLIPFAAELAHRCNVRFNAAAYADRPEVTVTTVVATDPFAAWNGDDFAELMGYEPLGLGADDALRVAMEDEGDRDPVDALTG